MRRKIILLVLWSSCSAFAADESANKTCMASIYMAQKTFFQTHKKYSSKADEIKTALRHMCPEDAKISMAGFPDSFLAVVKFKDDLWVINDQKVMLRGQL